MTTYVLACLEKKQQNSANYSIFNIADVRSSYPIEEFCNFGLEVDVFVLFLFCFSI